MLLPIHPYLVELFMPGIEEMWNLNPELKWTNVDGSVKAYTLASSPAFQRGNQAYLQMNEHGIAMHISARLLKNKKQVVVFFRGGCLL